MVKKIGILGFGIEGRAMLSFLKKQRNRAIILILDRKKKNLPGFYGKNYLSHLKDFDLIYRSPGILYSNNKVQSALKSGVKFSSGTEVFFKEIKKAKPKLIGITGTKGKGTTATLLHNILKASGYKVELVGNIGKPAISVLEKAKKSDYVIYELSSFQLQGLKTSPDIAVLLGIFPDHLDAHKSFKEYTEAKTSISEFQKKNDKIFYVPGNKYVSAIVKKSKGKKITIKPFKDIDLKIPGKHNLLNATIAANVAKSLGCKENVIRKVLKKFTGLPYRLQFTKKINNIYFYADSAGTSPQTAAAAIMSFTEPTILIAGGKDKGLNYTPLSQAIKKSKVTDVILFGQNKNKIKRYIKSSKANIQIKNTLLQATKSAYSIAKKNKDKTIILFSPASASFDQFEDYAHRGKKFIEIVSTLQKSR